MRIRRSSPLREDAWIGYSLLGARRGAPEISVRLEARGVELAPGGMGSGSTGSGSTGSGSTGSGGGGALPDVASLELDVADLVVRQPGQEPEHVDVLRGRGSLRGGTARVDS